MTEAGNSTRQPGASSRPLACAAVLLAITAGTTGCSRVAVHEPPRRIFLITVDTLRADHLGAYGYERPTSPSIDRLARDGVRFDRAIAQWPLTGPSFASIMSGRYPRATGRIGEPHVAPPAGVLLLPEYLRANGYTTVAVVSNRVLAREAGWDRGFDEFHETWAGAGRPLRVPAELKSWLTAPRVNALAVPLLERRREADRLFVWLHYSDPHSPYTLPPDFESPFSSTDPTPIPQNLSRSLEVEGLNDVGDYVANYDANVLIADRAIGQVLEIARELEILDDALVIFTADHGESLGDHDYYFQHGRYPYNASSQVPLVVHMPSRFPAGTEVPHPVELIDLYPTLRDLVDPQGIGKGADTGELSGASLLPSLLGAAEPGRVAVTESRLGRTSLLAAQDLDWKLILRVRKGRGSKVKPGHELYRLIDDPAEKNNLFRHERAASLSLRRHLSEWLADTIESEPTESPALDDEMRDALKALGYLHDDH